MRDTIRYRLSAVCLLFPLLLGACGEPRSASDLWLNYRYRLGNSLQSGFTEVAAPLPANPAWRYPGRRQIRLAVEPVRVNLLAFLQLSPCELQRLIGERNSSLGRLAPESQRLLYELRFLQLAKSCLDYLQSEAGSGRELASQLRQAIAIKHRNLSRVTWNALNVSRELQSLFALSTRPLAPGELQYSPVRLMQSLDYLHFLLRDIAAGAKQVTGEALLERHFQVLGSDAYAGRLLLSLALATEHLNRITPVLRGRQLKRPLCYQRRPSPQARIVERVFHKYYIGEIQPYLAVLHQQAQALQRRLQQLYLAYLENLEPPPAYQLWWQATWAVESESEAGGSVWQEFNRALSNHTRAWQGLLANCGLMPGPAGEPAPPVSRG